MKKNNLIPEQSPPPESTIQALRHWAIEIAQGAISPPKLSKLFLKLRAQNFELKLQNEELLRAQAELEVARTRYFNLYDQAPVSYFTISEKGLIMDTNLASANLIGVAQGALIEQSISRFIFDEDQSIYHNHSKQLFESGEPQECELRMVKKNGAIFWTQMVSTIAQEVQSQPMCRAVLCNISHIKHREEELKAEKEAAEHAHLVKSQFLANLSHEIRTPLNALIGTLQVMQMTEITAEQKEYVNVSKTSADALLTLINNILDYTRIEAGKIELLKEVFSLKKTLKDAENQFRFYLAEKELILGTFIGGDVPDALIGDSVKLAQVLSNLIGNAVKYTDVGRIDVSVEQIWELDNNKTKLKFTIKDTGIGIPIDKIDILFDLYTQVDNSNTRQHRGTGLGLAISKKLVELMSGEMWAKSKDGMGSSFCFTCVMEKALQEKKR